MFTVYVLQAKDGRLYKGMTSDLERRMAEHRRGKTRTTKNMGELRVIYTEQKETWEEAHRRELYFKSAAGRKFLKHITGA